MKKFSFIKVIALILCITMFASCGGNASNNNNTQTGNINTYDYTIYDDPINIDTSGKLNGKLTSTGSVVTELEEYGTTFENLHKIDVKERNLPFAVDGQTDYVIIADGAKAEEAASFIQQHVKLATNATLGIITDPDSVRYSEDAKYIVINCDEMFEEAGLTMPEDDLLWSGFYIKTVDNSVFLQHASQYGYGAQQAAIRFLNVVIGYDMFSFDCVVYEKDGKTLPEMEIIEKPDFDYIMPSNRIMTETVAYGMGFSTGNLGPAMSGYGTTSGHNSISYIPRSEYQDEHPKWYAANELCFTAHGDTAEYELMVKTVAEKVLKIQALYDDRRNICIGMQDLTGGYCMCDACAAEYEKYGGSIVSVWIKFINQVNRYVQAELQKEADKNGTEKRPLEFMFLAYHYNLNPPVRLNDKGEYEAIDETVICDPEVTPWIADYYGAYYLPYNHADNQSHLAPIEGWDAIAEELYFYPYPQSWGMYPYDSFDVLYEQLRTYYAHGGNWNGPEGTIAINYEFAFGALLQYMLAKGCFNVNYNYYEIVDRFFENYFLDAAPYMREYFDKMLVHWRVNEELFSGAHSWIQDSKLWPYSVLAEWYDLTQQAIAAIEHYQTEDVELYQKLKNRILAENIFIRVVLYSDYAGKYTESELLANRIQTRDDAILLGLDNKLLAEFTSWGI